MTTIEFTEIKRLFGGSADINRAFPLDGESVKMNTKIRGQGC